MTGPHGNDRDDAEAILRTVHKLLQEVAGHRASGHEQGLVLRESAANQC